MSLRNVLLVAIAVAVAAIGWSWWSSDAQQIARRTKALLATAAKSPDEGQVTAALKARELVSYFADPFRFRARQFDFETSDRQALTRTVAAYRLRADRIAAQVLDRRLDVAPDGRRATLMLTVRFVGGLRGLAEEAYVFQVDWVRQEGEWRIDSVDLLEIVPGLGS